MTPFSPEHLAQLRAETPGAAHRIHLNNAGAGLMPQQVIDAIQGHIHLESVAGGYEAAAEAAPRIEAFYSNVAKMTGAKAQNIAYAASATDAYNRALSSVVFERGDVILTTLVDYASNQIAFLQLQQRQGVEVIRAESLPEGGVDPDHMKELIQKHHPRMVAVTHVPNNSGLIQNVEAVGQLCRQNDILYLVDACQSAGQLPLDVEKIHCDFLSATFRKFLRGPRGAGFLFVSDRVLMSGMAPVFLDLFSAQWVEADEYEPMPDARRFELWEKPYALVLGASACAEYATNLGLENIAKRVGELAAYCRQQLATIAGVRVLDKGPQLCGIVTFHVKGGDGQALRAALHEKGINNSAAPRFAALIDFDQKGVTWALRLSPHYYNTHEEMDVAIGALREILSH